MKKEIILTKEQENKLEEIAMAYSIEIMERGGLDERHNDREDFPEISIWAIKSIMEEAYKAGLEDGKKMV
ncbi:MAG: hypothetical protein J6Y48_20750 [Clostridia bacterium]|nr:hypothetical protein [Clostridia bacterium]MBP5729506.1 hypothetical protein [Clostridia bacterium]